MIFIEISLIVVCSIFVIGVIVKSIIDKKKGKNSCGGCCASCKGCSRETNKKED